LLLPLLDCMYVSSAGVESYDINLEKQKVVVAEGVA
jgi:hypothetical protein